MKAKDSPGTPGIGSGPYGSNYGFNNEDTGMEFGISKVKEGAESRQDQASRRKKIKKTSGK